VNNNYLFKKDILLSSNLCYLCTILPFLGLLIANTYAQQVFCVSNDYNASIFKTTFKTTHTVSVYDDFNNGKTDGDPITVSRFVVNGTSTNAGDTYTIAGVGNITINVERIYTFVAVDAYGGLVSTAIYYILGNIILTWTDFHIYIILMFRIMLIIFLMYKFI